jgi:hypothetical protein
MKKYVMTILIIFVSVLVGYMFIVLCSIPSYPLFPFDIQKTNGDREQGAVVSVSAHDWSDGVAPLPSKVGAYIIELSCDNDIVSRAVNASELSRIPEVGDVMCGYIYLYKMRLSHEWKTFKPFERYTYPDYSIAWREPSFVSGSNDS